MNTLIQTAEQYVKDHPRCKVEELAEALSISEHRARTLASEMELTGRIYKTRIPGSRRSYLTHGIKPKQASKEPYCNGMPKQVIVGEWTPMDIKPQGIFGPLGM